MSDEWTIEVYDAGDGTVPFESFVDDLSDVKALALDAAVQRVLRERGIDLVRTEWLKALGEGLHEFRIRHDATEIARMFGGELPESVGRREKVLLRVFVHFHGARIVLLLGGYDKGVDPKERRQQREIARARRLPKSRSEVNHVRIARPLCDTTRRAPTTTSASAASTRDE